jgi:hypothetical protein
MFDTVRTGLGLLIQQLAEARTKVPSGPPDRIYFLPSSFLQARTVPSRPGFLFPAAAGCGAVALQGLKPAIAANVAA